MALPTIKDWENRVALVTGGSSGIGAAICKTLAQAGLVVIGCARNQERMDELVEECNKMGFPGKLHSYKCDVTNDAQIDAMFEWIKEKFSGVDVCINNCGISVKDNLTGLSPSVMREALNLNVVAVSVCTNKAIASMRERNVNGHIININSLLGKVVQPILPFYGSTKFALTSLTQSLRLELAALKLPIRVTGIHPGMVATEFFYREWGEENAEKIYKAYHPVLSSQDVADTVLYALSTPSHVQIEDITLQGMGAFLQPEF